MSATRPAVIICRPCRDRNSRRVQDRRGDAATATSSSAGLRTRGSDDTSATAADAVHVAQAAALLEEFKTKSKPQGFELKVCVQPKVPLWPPPIPSHSAHYNPYRASPKVGFSAVALCNFCAMPSSFSGLSLYQGLGSRKCGFCDIAGTVPSSPVQVGGSDYD